SHLVPGRRAVPIEDLVAQLLRLVVEDLKRGEVAVHHMVEQTVNEEAAAVTGQVGGVVPAGHHVVDVELAGSVHGDQRALRDERGDRDRLQVYPVRDPDGV